MTKKQALAEAGVEGFRKNLGPFVIAVETTRMPMLFTNATDEHHPVIFANASFLTLFGYEEAEILGMGFETLLVKGATQEALTLVQTAFRSDSTLDMEIKCQRKDGSELWASLFISPVRDVSGHTLQNFISLMDITTQKEENEQLRLLKTKMIYISRLNAMGTMAATLAHELNQPLAAITNYASGMQEQITRGAGSSELKHPIAAIEKNANRAGKIIAGLQKMTRTGETSSERFKPDRAIKDAGTIASAGACAGTHLRYELHNGKPVLGDPIQIQQVLINLIRNACDAVADCRDRDVVVRSMLVGKDTLISVEDSGSGISPENLPAVFDSYFTTKEKGMGLGLSISRTIIEAHGGKIWAENRPEGGARFSFTLPFAKSPIADSSILR